ncbi:MAG TPA: diguanylate cyclase [Cellvibrio sp.]|nr:diguanylate cyclase [Cellvibrio sp.]
MESNIDQPFEKIACSRRESDCHFSHDIAELRREVSYLTEQVRTDGLTGLFNFRFFKETIELEMERTRRGTQTLSMILLDIDHFKKFNDDWGHEQGNNALLHVSNLIKLAVRKLDYPCRFGGEEFIILLPNTDLRQAISVADRLREMLATTPLSLDEQRQLTVTASFGVDEFSSHMSDSVEGFIQRVDALLYQAKHRGRNRVAHPDLSATTFVDQSVTMEEKNALFDMLNDNKE